MSEQEVADYAERWFLVVSNWSMLLPIIRLIIFSAKKDDDTTRNCCARFWCTASNMNRFIVEIVLFTATMVLSSLYHLCDDSHEYTRICVTDYTALRYMDFIFSYHCIVTILLFMIDHYFTLFKLFAHGIFLIANVIFVTQYNSGINDSSYANIYYVGISIAGGLLIIAKIIYLKYYNILSHEILYHFDYVDFAAGLFFAAIGVMFKVLGSIYEDEYYYVYHSLWHIFVMIAINFGIETFNTKVSLFCWNRDRKCDCDNVVNGNVPMYKPILQ